MTKGKTGDHKYDDQRKTEGSKQKGRESFHPCLLSQSL